MNINMHTSNLKGQFAICSGLGKLAGAVRRRGAPVPGGASNASHRGSVEDKLMKYSLRIRKVMS